jgi:predicted CXXCH cytochrome family protein
MYKSKVQHINLIRCGNVSVAFALLVLVASFVGSCDEVERHKVLDYFFDGVPPLGGQEFEEELYDPNAQELDQTGQTSVWYVHEPRKDCTNCHQKRNTRGFSAQTYLIAPVPKLCYNCHDDYTATASYVHGPVAIGQCLFCHTPHKSRIEHLLKRPEPELCYLCHDTHMIELIPAHLPGQTSACTDCHNPHAGSTKALLNGAPTNEESPTTHKEHNSLSKQEREIAKLYYRSMKLYREGQLSQAREGFVKVLNSGQIPSPMAETLRVRIADIDNRLARAQARP